MDILCIVLGSFLGGAGLSMLNAAIRHRSQRKMSIAPFSVLPLGDGERAVIVKFTANEWTVFQKIVQTNGCSQEVTVHQALANMENIVFNHMIGAKYSITSLNGESTPVSFLVGGVETKDESLRQQRRSGFHIG